MTDHTQKPDRRRVLGKTVTVTVDRPIGSVHPEYPATIYPVNYGFIEGVTAGDGEAQDAYILGVSEPVSAFTGTVAAVIQRKDDVEEKWVVIPEHTVLYEPDMKAAVDFQEQYFDSHFICLYEKSCGAVLFTEREGQRLFLIIQNESGHIGFPKGHVEYGETELETARREIFEETSVPADFLPGFREEYDYMVNSYTCKKAVYFLAGFAAQKIIVPQSEISRNWLVPCETAMPLLNFEPDRRILARAEKFLSVSGAGRR